MRPKALRAPRLRRIAVALVLGAITNVLVAGWCVYGVSTHLRWVYCGYWSEGGRDYGVSLHASAGKAMSYWHEADPGETRYVAWKAGVTSADPTEAGVPPGRRPPRWTTFGDERIARRLAEHPSVGTPGGLAVSSRCDVAYGWPLLSFRGGMMNLATGSGRGWLVEHDFGPELPMIETPEGPRTANGRPMMTMTEPRTMPLTPILSGAMVNTAVYGGAWWVVLFVPGVVRRWRRRRRGRCVACGYDRRGIGVEAVCPECGDHEPAARAAGGAAMVTGDRG